jgi:hypothetical protein
MVGAIRDGAAPIPAPKPGDEPVTVVFDDGQMARTPHIAPVTSGPHANFIILDRSGENRTLEITVPRL